MSAALLERIRGIAADVLEVPATQLTPHSSAESIESWDSVRHLNLILALEQEFGIQFEPEEIDKLTSMEQIVTILDSKLNHTR